MVDRWYFTHAGQVLGPVTVAQLWDRATAGELLPADRIWPESGKPSDAVEAKVVLGIANPSAPTSAWVNEMKAAQPAASFKPAIPDWLSDVADPLPKTPTSARVNETKAAQPAVPSNPAVPADSVWRMEDVLDTQPATSSKSVLPDWLMDVEVVPIRGASMVFGRDPACDQPLGYATISWHHARLSRRGGLFVLEDLGSSYGTIVNGRRIGALTPVESGDIIGLGSYTFTLRNDGTLGKQDSRGHLTLEARHIFVEVPGKRLLATLSFTVNPSELVGLMGPSGAGKTTLLNALNGYIEPTSGDIFFNGQSLYDHYDQFRTSIGYVPQEDVMHRDLSVGQALYYSARLRLPRDYSDIDIEARIAQVVEQLGLQGTENVLIGSAEKKGISGGQRKRVNLAMELLTDPLILFLDEPTSGLSSQDAVKVMQLLRQLADAGKTILISIHQPSLEVFRLMDNLVVVGRDEGATQEPGQLVYYGPAYPAAVHFFNPQGVPNLSPGTDPSPDEVLRGLGRQRVQHWVVAYKTSPQYRQYVSERASQRPTGTTARHPTSLTHAEPLSQCRTLVRRGLARKFGDRINTLVLLAQAPVIGLLIMWVFGKQLNEATDANNFVSWQKMAGGVSTCLFQLTVAALWFGCSNAVREIVGEWAVYHRERMVNLKIVPFVASKFFLLGTLCLLQCAVLLGIVYKGCGLQGAWLPMYLIMVLMALTGVALGLILSAASRTQEIALGLLPIVLLTMTVLGGGMQPVHELPGPMQKASYAIPSRWGFEGMLLLEAKQRPNATPPGMDKTEDMAELRFPADKTRGSVLRAVGALAVLFTVTTGLIIGILRYRDVH